MATSRDDEPIATRGAADPAGQAAGAIDPTSRAGGAVLAGGRSRRMGRDKAGIEVAGATLLERARSAVGAALGPHAPVVAIGTPGGPHPGVWVPDRRPGAGPLAGLEAALGWAQAEELEAVLLVGVDHPWLEPQVLRLLVDRLLVDRLLVDRLHEARLPADPPPSNPERSSAAASDPPPSRGGATGGPQGVVLGTTDGPLLLLGAYRTDALSVVARLLDDGERRLQALRLHLDLEVVPSAAWRHLDPGGMTARDVDDPSALEGARRHLDPGSHPGGGPVG